MSNLTLFKGGKQVSLKNASKMVNALKGAAAEGASTDLPDGGVYVSFSGKAGRYSIGQDKNDAQPDEIWLVNVLSFEGGWICWKGGSPVAKRMASIFEGQVQTPDFQEHGPFNVQAGEGWHAAKAFMMRSLDKGMQGYFSSNTKSAVREFAKVEGEIARRMEEQLPCWPIIQLHKEQFTAKGMKNYKPILTIVGWLGMTQVNELAAMSSNDEIIGAIDELIAEAADDERNGVPDTTLSGADGAGEADDEGEIIEDEDEDDIEDAEVVEDEIEDEIEDEDEDEDEAEAEPEPEPAPALTSRTRRAAAAARTTEPEPAPEPARAGGLARRRRAGV